MSGTLEIVESFVAIVKPATPMDPYDRLMQIREGALKWVNDPEFKSIQKHEKAWKFFKDHHKNVADWIARIRHVRLMFPNPEDYLKGLGGLRGGGIAYESAMARIGAQEAYVARMAQVAASNATASAAQGTLVAGAGTTVAAVVIPVVGMIAVQVALGAGLYQAREKAKEEGYARGFAKGFITGLLKWELRFLINRFWDNALNRNVVDEMISTLAARAHNEGLLEGRLAGLAIDDPVKKDYLHVLKLITNASQAGWTSRSDDWMEQMRARQVQISYVIDLSVAARKYGIIQVV